MKKLSFEEMEKVQGGKMSVGCGLAIAGVALSITAFVITPYVALPLLLWGGGHLVASASVIYSC